MILRVSTVFMNIQKIQTIRLQPENQQPQETAKTVFYWLQSTIFSDKT